MYELLRLIQVLNVYWLNVLIIMFVLKIALNTVSTKMTLKKIQ